jgi:uncharacterized membrane protein
MIPGHRRKGVESMNDVGAIPSSTPRPDPGLVTLTHVVYGLHAFSALSGLAGTAFVVFAFLSGWPSILAVAINYVKRAEARGTYLESHFRWQIRTFWIALAWFIALVLLAVVLVLIPAISIIGLPIAIGFGGLLIGAAVVVGLWVLYRIARGWINLANGGAMPM